MQWMLTNDDNMSLRASRTAQRWGLRPLMDDWVMCTESCWHWLSGDVPLSCLQWKTCLCRLFSCLKTNACFLSSSPSLCQSRFFLTCFYDVLASASVLDYACVVSLFLSLTLPVWHLPTASCCASSRTICLSCILFSNAIVNWKIHSGMLVSCSIIHAYCLYIYFSSCALLSCPLPSFLLDVLLPHEVSPWCWRWLSSNIIMSSTKHQTHMLISCFLVLLLSFFFRTCFCSSLPLVALSVFSYFETFGRFTHASWSGGWTSILALFASLIHFSLFNLFVSLRVQVASHTGCALVSWLEWKTRR